MVRDTERSYLRQAVRGVSLLTGMAVGFVLVAALVAVVLSLLVG